jgi:hypothetical protein
MRPIASRVPNTQDIERTKQFAGLYNEIHGPKQQSLF